LLAVVLNGCSNQAEGEKDSEQDLPIVTTTPNVDNSLDDSKYCVFLQIGGQPGEINVSWVNAIEEEMSFFMMEQGEAEPLYYVPVVSYNEEEQVYSYQISIDDLDPETDYYYGIMNSEGKARYYSYTTPEYEDSFQFLFAGDPQLQEETLEADAQGWRNTIEVSKNKFPFAAFLVSAGDQVDNPIESLYQGLASSEDLKSIPLAINIGNHDARSKLYLSHFSMPNRHPRGNYWYQFGKTLFIALNSNVTDYDMHREFIENAKAEYQNENQEEEEWLIITMHHSLYSVSYHADSEKTLERRVALSNMFSEYDVDLVLSGHDHCYTRSYLVKNEVPDIKPLPYESAQKETGQVLYISGSSSSGSKFYERTEEEYPFAAVDNTEEKAQISSIFVNEDHIKIQTYRVEDMSLVDEFTLFK